MELLAGRCGAAVALEPATGRVLVLASQPDVRPEPRRGRLRRGRAIRGAGAVQARGAAPQPRHAGALHPRLDVQGGDRGGGARLGRVHASQRVRRPRLLHRVREARLQLRRPERPAGVRPRRLRRGAAVLDQLGLLQHRQGARARASSSTTRRSFGFYEDPPLETPVRRALAERPLPQRAALRSRRPERRSTRAGSPSARSGCS